MYPQNITVRLKFSVRDICKSWSHSSYCKHNLHELFDECHTLSSPEMMIIIDHNTNIYVE